MFVALTGASDREYIKLLTNQISNKGWFLVMSWAMAKTGSSEMKHTELSCQLYRVCIKYYSATNEIAFTLLELGFCYPRNALALHKGLFGYNLLTRSVRGNPNCNSGYMLFV